MICPIRIFRPIRGQTFPFNINVLTFIKGLIKRSLQQEYSRLCSEPLPDREILGMMLSG
jgi:hypothetical protein